MKWRLMTLEATPPPLKFKVPLVEDFDEWCALFNQHNQDPETPSIHDWIERHSAYYVALPYAREQYEAGHLDAILFALSRCYRYDLEVPGWAKEGLLRITDSIELFQARGWDEVLGRPIPKGTHIASVRKRHRLRPAVFNEVLAELEKGSPIDEALFERVGQKLGAGKSLVSELYYEEKKRATEDWPGFF